MHNNKMRRRWALGLVALALGTVAAVSVETYSAQEVIWTQPRTSNVTGASLDNDQTTVRAEAYEVIWT